MLKLPKKPKSLPVYDWYDNQDENEWICLNDEDVFYVCGYKRIQLDIKVQDLEIKDGMVEVIFDD